MLDELKQHKKVVGLKQTIKAVEADRVQMVYIARDADEHLISKVRDLCCKKGIQVYEAESMKVLGKASGIDVGTATTAVLK